MDFRYTVSGKSQQSIFTFHFGQAHLAKSSQMKNSVLLLDDAEKERANFRLKERAMVLDLTLKKRHGSTSIGEELASFLSRYGIRFDRID